MKTRQYILSIFECKEYHRTLNESRSDTNADGQLNSLDLNILRKLLIEAVSFDSIMFDPNGDSEINIRDIVRLKKYLV